MAILTILAVSFKMSILTAFFLFFCDNLSSYIPCPAVKKIEIANCHVQDGREMVADDYLIGCSQWSFASGSWPLQGRSIPGPSPMDKLFLNFFFNVHIQT